MNLQPRGQAQKNPVPPGKPCPDCGETVAYRFDKDEGDFATRVTGCDGCGRFWKYPVDIRSARDLR